MSFQGTATISRTAQELSEEFTSMGFDVSEAQIRSMICESDVVGDRNTDVWVEAVDRRPGDLENHPHLVFCVLDLDKPGAVADKTYKAV